MNAKLRTRNLNNRRAYIGLNTRRRLGDYCGFNRFTLTRDLHAHDFATAFGRGVCWEN